MESAVGTIAEARPTVIERTAAIPWHCYAVVLGATSILIGGLWDISWHETIGRDSFWTPAHIAIYLGGIIPGFTCGWLVLKATFAGTAQERAAAVRFWGFYGPLGAWVCIWGALAMLTSAPFDDWWHNAYGLDVEILSPPHTLLAVGMIAVRLGALLMVLALQNQAAKAQERGLGILFLFVASGFLLAEAILAMEYSFPNQQHGALFYQISCAAYPLILVATARASQLRWPATSAAAFYMGSVLAMVWILPLFPAEPKLAPIYTPVDHMVPPLFPLLLVLPALAIDVLMQRMGRGRDGLLVILAGTAFLSVFFIGQWFFSEFMLTPYSHNWFFSGDAHWPYFSRPGEWRYLFWNQESDAVTVQGLSMALVISFFSVRVGLWWGNWMERVKR